MYILILYSYILLSWFAESLLTSVGENKKFRNEMLNKDVNKLFLGI